MDLADVVTNPDLVVKNLGSWPSFHDAEIMSIELSRMDGVTAKLAVKAIPFDPSGKSRTSLLTFFFEGLDDDMQLGYFNHQNVVNGLTVETTDDRLKLTLEPCYGLNGSCTFSSARVLDARPVE